MREASLDRIQDAPASSWDSDLESISVSCTLYEDRDSRSGQSNWQIANASFLGRLSSFFVPIGTAGEILHGRTDRMTDKIRGAIAILVGVFALFQSYELYRARRLDWHLWVELVAGVILIVLGGWRIRRKEEDPTAELLK
jgi:hypothetical protein